MLKANVSHAINLILCKYIKGVKQNTNGPPADKSSPWLVPRLSMGLVNKFFAAKSDKVAIFTQE
jgi:hypothetical protein